MTNKIEMHKAKIFKINSKQKGSTDACPFLGLMEDSQTLINFPSGGNFCHKVNPPLGVALLHQSSHCLSESNHVACPIYKASKVNSIPNGIAAHSTKLKNAIPRWLWVTMFIALSSLIITLVAVFFA